MTTKVRWKPSQFGTFEPVSIETPKLETPKERESKREQERERERESKRERARERERERERERARNPKTNLISSSVQLQVFLRAWFEDLPSNSYMAFTVRTQHPALSRQLLNAISPAVMHHKRRLCHTDLKPENILLVSAEYVVEHREV
eukprot:SAG31_NODE_356_length_17180_cov_7.595925_6_plen_148_part_00